MLPDLVARSVYDMARQGRLSWQEADELLADTRSDDGVTNARANTALDMMSGDVTVSLLEVHKALILAFADGLTPEQISANLGLAADLIGRVTQTDS